MGVKVAKFGGSSLADAQHFRKVQEICFQIRHVVWLCRVRLPENEVIRM